MADARILRLPREATLVDAMVPGNSALRDVAVIVGMSWLIALCAQVRIVIPGTVVPITGQSLAVLYAGALLGSRRGAAAVALYLFQGGLGLPFFAGGAAGFLQFLGPTGGYLLGFVPAAWVTGALAQRGWDRSPARALAMMLIGSSLIFLFGLLLLSRFVPGESLLGMGLYPFIPGDIAKACVSAALLPWGWKLLKKGRKEG